VFDYDAELRRYNLRLRQAAEVRPDDRVLDVGCGTGQATREAARAATSGTAVGVDLSPAMVDRARQLSEEEGIPNVGFELADAQTHPFAPGTFTVGVSRFGTMFFPDPVAAFTNIWRAMRPGARLVQLVWQAHDQQEWTGAIRSALAGPGSQKAPTGLTHAAFSMADPAVATGVLTEAGFTAIEISDVREPIYYGPDAASALEALSGLGMAEDLVADLDAVERARALERLLALLDAHDTGEGVWFDSGAWLITVFRP
jgi:SAM-dependent methyltransferase